MLRSRLVVGILCCSTFLGLPLCQARAQNVKATDFVSENPRAFVDVPKGSPLYRAALGLEQAGLFTGYPDRTFEGKRALNRYEFAVAIQRMWQVMSRAVATVEKGQFSLTWDWLYKKVPNGRTRAAALLATFQDGEKLTLAVTSLQTLVTEFGPELKLLGEDPKQPRKEIAGWLQRVGKLSDQAAGLKLPDGPHQEPSEKK